MIEDNMDELLQLHDDYQDGKINLDEAVRRAQYTIDLPHEALRKIFKDIKRDNVIKIAG